MTIFQKIRRSVITLVIIMICYILQSTFFRYIDFAGITPNLLLIATASLSLMRGEREGIGIGFVCGLVLDVFSSNILGLFALLYMGIGFGCGLLHRLFYSEKIALPFMVILFSDLALSFICFFLFFLIRGNFHFLYYLQSIMLPEAIYTSAVSLGLYPLLLSLNGYLEDIEQRSAKKFV